MKKAPYEHLHIYEIAGDARKALKTPPAEYLGLWLEGDSSFVFFSRPVENYMDTLLASDQSLKLLDRHYLTYEDWQGGMELEPLVVMDLAVVPAWEPSLPGSFAGKLLKLDPGLVFGNGLHPTTRHCLEFLGQRAKAAPLGRVMDLGCGTGILGIAACLWGAESLLAVDLNPLCIKTTQANAELNQVEAQVEEGPAADYLANPAEVVLANIHWEIQRDLWQDRSLLDGKKDLILSGVTRSQIGPLKDLITARGYKIEQEKQAEDTWFTIWCRT